MDIKNIKKIHFIGVGGIGVSALALIMKNKGCEITGSDIKYSEITENLEKKGIKVFYKQIADNITKDIDLVVKTSAVKNNPETEKAKELNIPVMSRGKFLAMLSNEYKLIAVAGSHGKTTTTALIIYALKYLGKKVSFNVGGILSNFNTNSLLEESEIFVTEADESDGTFLELKPYIALINNLDPEHLDYYGDFDNLKKAFREFQNNSVITIYNIDDKNLNSVLKSKKTFGFGENAFYRPKNIEEKDTHTEFDFYKGEEIVKRYRIPLTGRYNVINVAGVLSCMDNLGIDIRNIDFSEFKGVKRRSELIYKNEVKNIGFYDDYAHHPVEIKALFENILKKKNTVILYQPHRYTRTRDSFDELLSALKMPDRLIVLKEYAASEEVIEGAGAFDLYKRLNPEDYEFLRFAESKEEAKKIILENFKENFILYSVGAGNLNEVLYSLRDEY